MSLNEKYRPQNFEELVGQEHVKSKLKGSELEEMEHLMFIGPAGTGKTTTAHILKNKFFKDGSASMNFKEINASSENSIDDIRDKVEQFAKTRPQNASKNIIFLDESDNISKSGQQALRRVMEDYADSTLFILSGNYENKFLDPIKSRCVVVHFDRIESSEISERLVDIAKEEEIEYNKETVDRIAEDSAGDIRSAVTSFWFGIEDGVLQKEVRTERSEIKPFVAGLVNGDHETAHEEKNTLMMKGMEEQKLIDLSYEIVKDSDGISDEIKSILIEEFADAEFRMKQDANKEIQLDRIIWRICGRIN